jgi:energy-coupling factor transporter ATP-binding protein EcfA2
MDDTSYEELVHRLTADEAIEDTIADLVLAAAEGPDALAVHLEGSPGPTRPKLEPELTPEPPHVYLTEIAVAGFRGVAPRARLPFEPGPGLTLVVGRNGSGKSSFAEGLELLLTGKNLRWEGKPKPWREGWRNLHAVGQTVVEARFQVEGESQPLEVKRSWASGGDLDGSDAPTVSGSFSSWDELGWDEALERYRPLLSYNELGAMFSDRAADLYSALSAVLGLEAFEVVQSTLREARLERERSGKTEKQIRRALSAELSASDDDRALAVREQIGKRSPDLDAVQAILVGGADDDGVARLSQLAHLILPDSDVVAARFDDLSAAQAEADQLSSTDAARDTRLADLLEGTLALHADHPPSDGRCPVCETPGVIDAAWAVKASREVEALRTASTQLSAAQRDASAAARRVEQLFSESTPAILRTAPAETDQALDAWDAWAGDRRDRDAAVALRSALADVSDSAKRELAVRDSAWQPLEDEIVRWLGSAREAVRDKEVAARLSKAEDWMKRCTASLRADRMKPIVGEAQSNWAELRHESNVALGDIELRKIGQQRMAVFDVTVDGAEASAFGVMSQGELSALAVSVFLPRASLPVSPFRFMVIDDPVQSMDPAKVDGLARVLGRAAKTRQVIVFTHDERLPQAVERLLIPARVINVKRRANSKVEIVPGSAPTERYIAEAFALANTTDLPDEIRARVVPGICRSAIEAACATRIRRRLLAEGRSHAAVEKRLSELTSTTTWLGEAFGIPVSKGKEIMDQVRRLGGERASEIVELTRRGAHEPLSGVTALELARGAERLVQRIEQP